MKPDLLERLREWRKLRGEGMVSAVGEYTPDEFWDLCDALETLAAEREKLVGELNRLALTAGALVVATDGVKALRIKRRRVVIAMESSAQALASVGERG